MLMQKLQWQAGQQSSEIVRMNTKYHGTLPCYRKLCEAKQIRYGKIFEQL